MSETCAWKFSDDAWETSCGQAFILTAGTPHDNDMKYCCYCGKPLEQVIPKEEEQP